MKQPVFTAIVSAIAFAASAGAAAVEKLAYSVEERFGDVEVRRYAPHFTATTDVEGEFKDAGHAAFPRLAGFIRGENAESRSIAMTAPVLQEPAEHGWDVSFVMPSGLDRATLPEPRDPHVHIREVGDQLLAAITYSGSWAEDRYREHEAALRAAIAATPYRICGAARWARYDPPFMPAFMRRNEVLIPVAKESC